MHWWWSFLNLSIILFDNKNALQYTYFTMRICTYRYASFNLFQYNVTLLYLVCWYTDFYNIYLYVSQLGMFVCILYSIVNQ